MDTPFIDYHAHLGSIEKDRDSLCKENAKKCAENNTKYIICGTGSADNKAAIELARKYRTLATIGIDPQNCEDSFEELIALWQENKDVVVGFGEIGIDLYWRQDNFDLQKEIFLKQIEFASNNNIPVVIHGRSAYREVFELIYPYRGKLKGSIHCFDGDLDIALKFVNEMQFMIGITGIVTFKNADVLREVVKGIPLENLLIETDSPYLAPGKYRGKTCLPYMIEETYKTIAEIKEVSLCQLKETVKNNLVKMIGADLKWILIFYFQDTVLCLKTENRKCRLELNWHLFVLFWCY